MAKRNRQTLKKSFSKGQKPTERDFENLIDSTLNILDDGFSKSPEAGLELTPLAGEKRVVLSVFREPGDPTPVWELRIGVGGELMIRNNHSSRPAITLFPEGDIEMGEQGKQLRVASGVEYPVRKGCFARGEVPADGKWHTITPELEGVYALEVVAAAGRRYTGKHAILVATATTCFATRSRIKKTGSHYGAFGNKLMIRWIKNGLKSSLQIKSFFRYGEDIQIRYHITGLWDDNRMEKG